MYQWVRFSVGCKSAISTIILAAHVHYACYKSGCMTVCKSMDHVGHWDKGSNITYTLRSVCISDNKIGY